MRGRLAAPAHGENGGHAGFVKWSTEKESDIVQADPRIRRQPARKYERCLTMLSSGEIRDFRRRTGRHMRNLRSVLIELDKMPNGLVVQNSIREIRSEMAGLRIQVDVCSDMLKARRSG